jgi:nucleotide-binding universal stress UspA family protein
MVNAADVQSYERRLIDDDTLNAMVTQARYADLVVVSQCDPADSAAGQLEVLPEHVALYGGRPVLVLPYAGKFERIDRHALVAWDGSRAAIRAVTDAVPLLRRSGKVTLAIFNPESQYGVHGEQPGADMALYLARHGVNVEVLVQNTPQGLDVGNALLSLSADLGIDLLVMGAYGHLRWRELVLGGVTRTIMRTMTVPVLMAH